jgi:hypothetical protein
MFVSQMSCHDELEALSKKSAQFSNVEDLFEELSVFSTQSQDPGISNGRDGSVSGFLVYNTTHLFYNTLIN